MNDVLQQIDDWLLANREVTTDHFGDGNKYLGFKVERHNHFDNVLFTLNDDTVFARYAEPFISGQRLSLGRWSRTVTCVFLLDVSVPMNVTAPPPWLLSQIYDVTCHAVDLMVSRLRLLLEHGIVVEDNSSKVETKSNDFSANDPAILPAWSVERLTLQSEES